MLACFQKHFILWIWWGCPKALLWREGLITVFNHGPNYMLAIGWWQNKPPVSPIPDCVAHSLVCKYTLQTVEPLHPSPTGLWMSPGWPPRTPPSPPIAVTPATTWRDLWLSAVWPMLRGVQHPPVSLKVSSCGDRIWMFPCIHFIFCALIVVDACPSMCPLSV